MYLTTMTRLSSMATFQKREGNREFPKLLLSGVIILFVILLSSRQNLLSLDLSGYRPYIVRTILSITFLALAGGIAGFAIIWFLTLEIFRHYFFLRWFPRILGAYLGTVWGIIHWEQTLLYLKGIKIGSPDPILGKDIAFYLFSLPFYEDLFMLLFSLLAVSLTCLFIRLLLQIKSEDALRQLINRKDRPSQKQYYWLYMNLGLLLLLFAWGKYLERYGLLYSQLGSDFDTPYANANLLLPSLDRVFMVIAMGTAFLIFPLIHHQFQFRLVSKSVLTGRCLRTNPHLRLIRHALAATLFILWSTTPKMYPPQMIKSAAIAPQVSAAVKLMECKTATVQIKYGRSPDSKRYLRQETPPVSLTASTSTLFRLFAGSSSPL
jgi:hypothetical protein